MQATRVIITVLLALALLPSVQADREITTDIDFTDPTEVNIVSIQNWTGEDARKLREDLDVMFGAADGTLEEQEIGNIEDATESDLNNRTTNLTTLNGELGNITEADVTIEGAAGPVDSAEAVQIRHDLHIAFPGVQENASELTFEHTVVEGGEVVLTAPEGFDIASTQGFESANVTEEGDRLTATAEEGEPFTVTFQEAEDTTGPGDGNQTGDGDDQAGTEVPAPGAALVAAAVGLAVAARALRGRLR